MSTETQLDGIFDAGAFCIKMFEQQSFDTRCKVQMMQHFVHHKHPVISAVQPILHMSALSRCHILALSVRLFACVAFLRFKVT